MVVEGHYLSVTVVRNGLEKDIGMHISILVKKKTSAVFSQKNSSSSVSAAN